MSRFPVALDDPDLLLNCDCKSAAAVTAAGGTVLGSGGTFDPVSGFTPGASSSLGFVGAVNSALMATEFTVVAFVHKSALSRPQSTSSAPQAEDVDTLFQSGGEDRASNAYIIIANGDPITTGNPDFIYWGQHSNDSNATFVRRSNNASAEWAKANYMGSDAGRDDYILHQIVVKDSGREMRMYEDGELFFESISTDPWSDTAFLANWWFGGTSNTGVGNYPIKDIQIIGRAIEPDDFASTNVTVFFGDSTTENGTKALTSGSSGNTTWQGAGIPRGTGSWIQAANKKCYRSDGFRFTYFNEGQSGHAIDPSNQGSPKPLFDHIPEVLAHNPKTVVLTMTINELHLNTPIVPATYAAALDAMLDALIDGGVQQVKLISPFPFHKTQDKTTYPINGFFADEAHRQQAISNVQAAIAIAESREGYRDAVTFHDQWTALGGVDYNPEYGIGSASDRASTDVAIQGDIHQAPLGHAAQAEFAYSNVIRPMFYDSAEGGFYADSGLTQSGGLYASSGLVEGAATLVRDSVGIFSTPAFSPVSERIFSQDAFRG